MVYGALALVKKDTIYVNGYEFALSAIRTIYVRETTRKTFSAETLLYTTAGVAISTTGMTLAKWANFKRALRYSGILGYGNFLIQYFPGLKRKKYETGKKFTLQAVDLRF